MTRLLPATWRSPEARIILSLALLLATLNAPRQVVGDTWFNLVLGRHIVRHGLVTHNDLTRESFGVACADPQWLAHVLHYAVERCIGVAGLVVVTSLLAVASLCGALAFARASGASAGRTLLVAVLALGSLMPQAVRAQSFAVPCFALFPCLLAADAREPARRTWWLVPLGAVWANLHGSAVLAPILGAVLALCRAIDGYRLRRHVDARALGRDLLLTASLGAALFASPYAPELLDYHRATLGNSVLQAYVGEWQPLPAREVATWVLLITLCVAVLRRGAVAPSFASVVCLLFAAATLRSARHSTPLAFVAAGLLPPILDAACGDVLRFEPDRLLARASRVALPASAALFAVASPLGVTHLLDSGLSPAFVERLARAALAAERVLADEYHADRLLWFRPELAGRLSHDTRLEILAPAFLENLNRAYFRPGDPAARAWLGSHDLVVVDRAAHAPLWRWLSAQASWVAIGHDAFASAFARSGTAAARAAEAGSEAPR